MLITRQWQIKELQIIKTLVFEKFGDVEKHVEFKIKDLQRWGFDLMFGLKDGKETFFAVESKAKKVNEEFEYEGVKYKIKEVLDKLPKNKKLICYIEIRDGIAYLIGDLVEENEEDIRILEVPAGEVLLTYFKKQKLNYLIEAIRNVGLVTEFIKHKGEQGKPYAYHELPPKAREFLKEAKKIAKETDFYRLSFAYFGENKDKKPRYWFSWLVPTISLFDLGIAKKIDQNIALWDVK